MRRLTIILLLAALAPPAVAAGAQGTFEAGRRGHVLVPVSVNGAEARPFVVDTGASQTVLDAMVFASLAETGAAIAIHGGQAQGAHGSFGAKPATLDSISLWELEHRDQFAALMKLAELTPGHEPDFAGVLGLPFLQRYRLDLDYPQRRIVLEPRDGAIAPCDFCTPEAAIRIKPLIGGLPSVPVTVNGLAMTALLDTGASRTILNEKAIAALGLANAGEGEMIGKVSLALGSLPAREHEASRIALPVFKTLRLDAVPAMILGIDYLGAGRMVLDLQAGVVWFQPAT